MLKWETPPPATALKCFLHVVSSIITIPQYTVYNTIKGASVHNEYFYFWYFRYVLLVYKHMYFYLSKMFFTCNGVYLRIIVLLDQKMWALCQQLILAKGNILTVVIML